MAAVLMDNSLTRNNIEENPSMPSRITFYSACAIAVLVCFSCGAARGADAPIARPIENDYVIRDFHFASGETMPELRVHYTIFGKPRKDALGKVTNAVLIMHGTGGSGRSLINDRFAGVLFQRGQLLDAEKYFIILPDGIGHGNSSRPTTFCTPISRNTLIKTW